MREMSNTVLIYSYTKNYSNKPSVHCPANKQTTWNEHIFTINNCDQIKKASSQATTPSSYNPSSLRKHFT